MGNVTVFIAIGWWEAKGSWHHEDSEERSLPKEQGWDWEVHLSRLRSLGTLRCSHGAGLYALSKQSQICRTSNAARSNGSSSLRLKALDTAVVSDAQSPGTGTEGGHTCSAVEEKHSRMMAGTSYTRTSRLDGCSPCPRNHHAQVLGLSPCFFEDKFTA